METNTFSAADQNFLRAMRISVDAPDTPPASMMELHAIELDRMKWEFQRQLLEVREQNAELWTSLGDSAEREQRLFHSRFNWQARFMLAVLVAISAVLWAWAEK
jgi:hypothetical protein